MYYNKGYLPLRKTFGVLQNSQMEKSRLEVLLARYRCLSGNGEDCTLSLLGFGIVSVRWLEIVNAQVRSKENSH